MDCFTRDRINQTLDVFRAFLRGERREPLLTVHAPLDYRQNPDPEKLVEGACAQIAADAVSGEPHVLPTFWPDFGTVSTAKLWGGKVMQASNGGGVHIEPVAPTLSMIENLTIHQTFEESDFHQGITLYRQVCERLETDDVFVRTPDFQGPMNTLALLTDQTELICGLYEEPELVERALDHVTDTLIATFRRFRDTVGPAKVIGNIWPFITLPDGQGVGITQDYMPLLGPELYERFELPRLKRIADAFGGVYIHCCGEYTQHLPALARADFKIWGIEVHYPYTKLWDVYDVLGDRVAYTPYLAPGVAEYPALVDLCREFARRDCASARFWFAQCPGWCDIRELQQVIERFGR